MSMHEQQKLHAKYIIFNEQIFPWCWWIAEHQHHDPNKFGSAFDGQQSGLIEGQTQQQQHQPQNQNETSQHDHYTQQINETNHPSQQTTSFGPNVAPGWRRQLSDGGIVYFRWVTAIRLSLYLSLVLSQCRSSGQQFTKVSLHVPWTI